MDKVAVRTHAGVKHVWYYGPGCKGLHNVPAERWHWNNSTESPTLTPSVRHFYTRPSKDDPNKTEEVTFCHYTIEKGVIKYCGDCPHALRSQNVEMTAPGDGVPDDS